MTYYLGGYYLIELKHLRPEVVPNQSYTCSECVNDCPVGTWAYTWTAEIVRRCLNYPITKVLFEIACRISWFIVFFD